MTKRQIYGYPFKSNIPGMSDEEFTARSFFPFGAYENLHSQIVEALRKVEKEDEAK